MIENSERDSFESSKHDSPLMAEDKKKFKKSSNTMGILGSGNEEFMSHPLFTALREAS